MKMEIINPSDKCYLENDDLEASCFVTMYISDGKYALNGEDGQELMPLFMFGGFEDFWQDKFGHSVEEFMESEEANKRLMAVCGTFGYAGERSSLNDIGKAIESFGSVIQKRMEESK